MIHENMRNLLGLLNIMVLVGVVLEWGGSLVRKCAYDREEWVNNQFVELLVFMTVLAILSISLAINRQTQPGISAIVVAILLGYAGIFALLMWLKYREE